MHTDTNSWLRRKIVVIPSALFAVSLALACGAGGADDTGALAGAGDAPAAAADTDAGADKGVYQFGQTVKFKDGSTLTVGKPAKFKRAEFAAGGEGKKHFLKFKATFKNNTEEIFDPSLTTAAASAGGEEGDSVFQEGLDAPDNKVLPGKSVTWHMGYGLNSNTDVQLEVNVGFLDYGTVIFTG